MIIFKKTIAAGVIMTFILCGCANTAPETNIESTVNTGVTAGIVSGTGTDTIREKGTAPADANTPENDVQSIDADIPFDADMESAVDLTSTSLNEDIHIDQIGYGSGNEKQVIVNGRGNGLFGVIDAAGGDVLFTGHLKKGPDDKSSGDNVYYGDFTEFQEPGDYRIFVPGMGVSYPFAIGDNVYKDVKNAILKSFYYQRCGMALDGKYAGAWAHDACHVEKAFVYGSDIQLDETGGWHDAGDYGKYTVAGAVAAADLMLAWEFFPGHFSEQINIPESGNNVPDILNETRYELEWLLKMQDNSGGVYHKVTSKAFPSLNTLPQDDFGKLFVYPVSAAATGDFAAVTAMASRIYKAYDPAFSERCLAASEKAWAWLSANRSVPGFTNPPDTSTGEYGDSNDSDERFWAACELYRTTGRNEYGEYIKSVYNSGTAGSCSFGWQNVGGFAKIAYLFTAEDKRDSGIYSYMRNEILKLADSKLGISKPDGYLTTLTPRDYGWGSNMTVMDDAMLMIIADMLRPNTGYINAAENNMHYLFGRNALNQAYITGYGSKPVKDPHHRPSKADAVDDPVPGLIVGGPDANLDDDIARSGLKGEPPARCYIDNSGSYSTNETAIYWNSPAVFVTGYFDR